MSDSPVQPEQPTPRPPASPRTERARAGFVIGLALTGALVGVQLIAYTALRIPFVPYALAEILRDLTPGAIKTAGIEVLSYSAKSLLIILAVALFILLGGVIGAAYNVIRPRLLSSHLLRGLLLGLFVFLISAPLEVAHHWIPGDLLLAPLGVLATSLLWGLAVDQSIRGAESRPDLPLSEGGMGSGLMSRRVFLVQTVAGGAVLGVFGITIAKLMEGGPLFTFNSPVGVPRPTPDIDGFVAARGTWPEVTPTDRFYQVDIGVGNTPELSADGWTLAINGLVETPATYSLDDLLKKFPQVTPFYGTLVCISNEVGGDLTSTALWEGWRLADLLKAAGIKDGAADVVFKCADGYSDSLPIAVAQDRDTYLVYRMNGEPLPAKHGYPLRVYIPTRYGEKNPKWITSIQVVDHNYLGYWQQQGWTDDALIKTSTTINTLNRQNNVSMINETTAEVGGIANGGGRGISRVEYRINDGAWQPSILKRPLSPFMWVLWKARFPAKPNERYKLSVRAIDGQGNVQIETPVPPHPTGASGYHTLDVFPVIDQLPTPTPTPSGREMF